METTGKIQTLQDLYTELGEMTEEDRNNISIGTHSEGNTEKIGLLGWGDEGAVVERFEKLEDDEAYCEVAQYFENIFNSHTALKNLPENAFEDSGCIIVTSGKGKAEWSSGI